MQLLFYNRVVKYILCAQLNLRSKFKQVLPWSPLVGDHLAQRAIAPFGIHYKVMYTSTKVRDDTLRSAAKVMYTPSRCVKEHQRNGAMARCAESIELGRP